MGLLGDVYSGADRIKRNLKRLLGYPLDYVDEAARVLANNIKDVATDPMHNLGPGAIGKFVSPAMTVWHGSPHKFDKFDMSKIGTGEGAQAYGHGLYMAEAPEVAKEYQKNLSQFSRFDGNPIVGNQNLSSGAKTYLLAENADLPKAIQNVKDAMVRKPNNELLPPILAELESLKPESITKSSSGQLYKVDIPDEAVARFLDWDKPLSQQAPEVQKALKTVVDSKHGQGTWDEWVKNSPDYRDFRNDLMETVSEDAISKQLLQQGIPGIRYLDGGSRSAGQGSYNFVLFDDQMPRIIERNGEATGLKPWKPGEWDGLQYRDPFGDSTR